MSWLDDLKSRLIKHEGLCLKPYECSSGKLTIGIGRNLSDNGLSKQEAYYLFDNDIKNAIRLCQNEFSFFTTLSKQRQGVLVEMCFNMGIKKLKTFKKMIEAIQNNDFKTASDEMLESRWAKQVKNRAKILAHLMKEEK